MTRYAGRGRRPLNAALPGARFSLATAPAHPARERGDPRRGVRGLAGYGIAGFSRTELGGLISSSSGVHKRLFGTSSAALRSAVDSGRMKYRTLLATLTTAGAIIGLSAGSASAATSAADAEVSSKLGWLRRRRLGLEYAVFERLRQLGSAHVEMQLGAGLCRLLGRHRRLRGFTVVVVRPVRPRRRRRAVHLARADRDPGGTAPATGPSTTRGTNSCPPGRFS